MNRPNDGVPGARDGLFDYTEWDTEADKLGEQDEASDAYSDDEPLTRLAQFAFVREEDDREVRLYFRDVPAGEIAAAFRRSGGLLISMTGERALSATATAVRRAEEQVEAGTQASATQEPRVPRKRGRHTDRTAARSAQTTGEVTLRYFFALRETVYTATITSTTGIAESVASVFPVAARSERELQDRLAILFTPESNRQ